MNDTHTHAEFAGGWEGISGGPDRTSLNECLIYPDNNTATIFIDTDAVSSGMIHIHAGKYRAWSTCAESKYSEACATTGWVTGFTTFTNIYTYMYTFYTRKPMFFVYCDDLFNLFIHFFQ